MNRKDVKGIVLAGGKSSRFGEDKATAKIEGVTLLEKAASLLKDLKLEPIVITNRSRDYSFLNCRIERDLIPDCGPLGGLYTACQIFPNASLLVLTCDMPGVTTNSIKILLEHHDDQNQVTLFDRCGDDPNHLLAPRTAGSLERYNSAPSLRSVLLPSRWWDEFQPFPGIYESTLSGSMLERIKTGESSLQCFLRSLSRIHVVPHGSDQKVLWNVNEKKDISFWRSL